MVLGGWHLDIVLLEKVNLRLLEGLVQQRLDLLLRELDLLLEELILLLGGLYLLLGELELEIGGLDLVLQESLKFSTGGRARFSTFGRATRYRLRVGSSSSATV